mmetsp:Transcript_27814/g.42789  ORF Transcript_27814/g.42789 Transcript_27814/m.42789 type:complete len:222 (+) Transcript_27814:490-1155(+)
MRFLYCACAISYMLKDWSGLNLPAAIEYIEQCRSYDGSISLIPGQEGHGGCTFCAIASIELMKRHYVSHYHDYDVCDIIDEDWKKQLIYWCVSRQVGGMQGRPNKAADSCYSYWIGGTLRLLQQPQDDSLLLHQEELCRFVMKCESSYGGFSKFPDVAPDPVHSFYSLAWLCLSRFNDQNVNDFETDDEKMFSLNRIDCALGMGLAHVQRLQNNKTEPTPS